MMARFDARLARRFCGLLVALALLAAGCIAAPSLAADGAEDGAQNVLYADVDWDRAYVYTYSGSLPGDNPSWPGRVMSPVAEDDRCGQTDGWYLALPDGLVGEDTTIIITDGRLTLSSPIPYAGGVMRWEGTGRTLSALSCSAEPAPPDAADVAALSATPSMLVLAPGESATVSVRVYPADAAGASLVWSSLDPAVAVVDSAGVVTARASGVTIVTATAANGVATSVAVQVTASSAPTPTPTPTPTPAATIPVEAVSVTPDPITVAVGEKTKVTAVFTPSDATNQQVYWETNDAKVFIVTADGTITGIAPGQTYLLAKVPGRRMIKVQVTVTEPGATPTPTPTPTPSPTPTSTSTPTPTPTPTATPTPSPTATIPVEAVSVTLDQTTVPVGGTAKATAVFTPSDATDQQVHWESSSTRIIIVTADGTITGVAPGKAYVMAKTPSGNMGMAQITVTEPASTPAPSETPAPPDPTPSETPDPAPTLDLDASEITVQIGSPITITARIGSALATGLSWSSTDEGIATVDGEGTVTGVGVGETTVTAITADGESRSVAVRVIEPVDVPAQTMWRLYNPNSGEHFYTASDEERDSLAASGWTDEGVGWIAPQKSDVPVYRLYDPNAGGHHYTADAEERDSLEAAGWTYEGVGWYGAVNEGRVPLYRLYNPNAASAGAHHYPLSARERTVLVASGWRDEGIAWYAVRSSD